MSLLAALVVLSAGTADVPTAHPLDPLMLDVTEACLLPRLADGDPRTYFTNHQWTAAGKNRFEKIIDGRRYTVDVVWPASKKAPSGCSFESDVTESAAVYEWFKLRIGEPKDIAWSDKQVGGWRIHTNGHDVGIYLSRKHTKPNERAGMMLHILQN